MKKLYSLISALILLILPIGVNAANVSIHFWNGSITYDTNTFGETQSITIKGSDLAAKFDDGTSLTYCVNSIEAGGTYTYKPNNAITENGGSTTCTYNTEGGNTITLPGNMSNYNLTFTASDYVEHSTIKMRVSWTLATEYQISTNNGASWTTVAASSTINSFPFKLRKKTGSSYTYFNSASGTLKSGTPLTASLSATATAATSYTTSDTSADGFTLKITDNAVSISSLDLANTYYLVSPELTGGEMLPEFQLIPSRVRNGGELSTKLYTINLKDDRVKKLLDAYNAANNVSGTTIHYWIKRASDNYTYRPYGKDNNYMLGTASPSTNTQNNNVKYQTYGNTTGGSTTNVFALNQGTGVSYTWMFDVSKQAPLTININLKAIAEAASKSYYVIGNFSSALADVNILPYTENNRVKMTRLIYNKGTDLGIPSTADFDAAKMDSVVYRVTIPRPSDGWGQLYMAVASSELITNNSSDWGTHWDDVIRPQVQGYGSKGSGMDGTALEGGIFWGDKSTNKSQALNPQAAGAYANATSYTFSINLTTSTYRISFNDENMYIWGPAVPETDATTFDYLDTDGQIKSYNALKLTWDDANQCFKYMGADGSKETPIVLTSANDFNFVYGHDFTNTWFGEDYSMGEGTVPADLTSTSNPYTASGDNFDTQYVNYVGQYKSSVNQMRDKKKKIMFNLRQNPNGYYIRLYIKKIGDQQRIFYTINRQMKFNDWSSISGTITDYHYYRAYSEWHAVKIPENVKAYVVSSVNAANKQVTLTELSTPYIPARTGVILAASAVGTNSLIDFETYAENPEAALPNDVTNLLTAQEDNVAIPVSDEVNGTTYYNYIFSYVTEGTTTNVAGFYKPNVGVKSGRNYAYLKNTNNFYTGTPAGAKGFRLFFSGETTGINSVSTAEDDNSYYNLQGMKTARPTQKGIYIQNGKKYIIK